MTIWCKHVRSLELQKFLHFCAAHLPVGLDIETKLLISYFKYKYNDFYSASISQQYWDSMALWRSVDVQIKV